MVSVSYIAKELKQKPDRWRGGGGGGERGGQREPQVRKQYFSGYQLCSLSPPAGGLCRIGDHEEDCTSQNQIPLEHSTALSQHTVTGCSTGQSQHRVTEHGNRHTAQRITTCCDP